MLRYPDGGHLSGTLPPGTICTIGEVATSAGTVAGAQRSAQEAEAKILTLLGDR